MKTNGRLLILKLFLWFGLMQIFFGQQLFSQQTMPVSVPQDARRTDEQLAFEFLRNREWEQAAPLFERLYNNYRALQYYNNYFECLVQLQQYDKAYRLARRAEKDQKNVQYEVDQAYITQLQGESLKAQKDFRAIIQSMVPDRNIIQLTANAFRTRGLDDYALEAYTYGSELAGVNYGFYLERSYLYQLSGNYSATIDAYLSLLETNPEQFEIIKARIQSMLMMDVDNSMVELVMEKLLAQTQQKPKNLLYSELFIWFLIQQKEYSLALSQAKALDRRFGEQDQRVMELSEISLSNNAFETALDGYDYLLKKGKSGAYYLESVKGSLKARYEIENSKPAPVFETFQDIAVSIDKVFEESGFNTQTYQLVFIQSSIYAYHAGRSTEAAAILEKAKMLPLPQSEIAAIKMQQADIMLFNDEVWEATLLYSQVDKSMKNEPLGHEARFRNARLRYYIGEFVWAQNQLDILKTATSKLIANDALQLSLLIQDNLADDTTGLSLKAFANADLLLFQKKDKEALSALDSLLSFDNTLALKPHIMLKKAEIAMRNNQNMLADSLLQEIYTQFPDHYLADDALFKSAQLNEAHTIAKISAQQLYEWVFEKYPASIYAVSARQKYRLLRGDKL